MPAYEYLATELVGDQQVITTLPLTSVRFGSVLNGAGAISAEVKLEPLPGGATVGGFGDGAFGDGAFGGEEFFGDSDDEVRERNRLVKDATEPARRACYVLRDGVIVGAYVWWSRTYNPETQVVSLAGAELWSLLRRRVISWESIHTGVDQLAIARSLVSSAQAVAGGDLDFVLDADTSGKVRDRSYFDYEAKPVAEAVEQLAAVIDGFDFAVVPTLANGAVTRTLDLFYPRRGRTAAKSGHVFEWGRNVTSLGWSEEASNTANSIVGLGAGEGLSKVRTRVTDTSALAEGYPLLEASISLGDVEDPATLDGHVRAELAQRKRPVTLPKVSVLGDSDPPLGSYVVGDDCWLTIPADSDPFWPTGLVLSRRIHAIDVTPPDDGGVETVDLTLGEATAGV